MNKENCALKLVDEIILNYDARSKKYQKTLQYFSTLNQKWQYLRKKVIYNQMCVLISPTNYVSIICHWKNISARYDQNVLVFM